MALGKLQANKIFPKKMRQGSGFKDKWIFFFYLFIFSKNSVLSLDFIRESITGDIIKRVFQIVHKATLFYLLIYLVGMQARERA